MRVGRSWNEATAACSEHHVHLAGVQRCLFWTDFEILMWNAFENPTVETEGT